MAYERDQTNQKHGVAHRGVYGSHQLVRPAQIEYLDYHSSKLEDKVRELKELVTHDYHDDDELLLRHTHGVLRSLRLVQTGVAVPAPAASTAYRARTSYRAGEYHLITHVLRFL